jgi:serine acetyltransferase
MKLTTIFRKLTDISGGSSGLPGISQWMMSVLSGYNHEKYWRRRSIVVNPLAKVNPIVKMYYLLYIKRVDYRFLCSFGTSYNAGAQFNTPPHLPHGPNGIIVGHDAKIGSNVTLFHQVTIPHGGVEIGDNTILYPGVKIIQGIKIGRNCRIGANVVVCEDIPDGATVVPQRARIILKK